ncbi:MAG: hypothetical protein Kow0025_26320 [Thermodesulfovibrionales bacterium]
MDLRKPLCLLAALAVIAFAQPARAAWGGEPPLYELSVSFDTARSLLSGRASIHVPAGGRVDLRTRGLTITALSLDGQAIEPGPAPHEMSFLGESRVEVSYEAVFDGSGEGGLISEDGISLTGPWYPAPEGLALYRLRATVPDGFMAVSESEETTARPTASGTEYSFGFGHPLPGVSLAAGPYVEVRKKAAGVDIYGYFLPGDEGLAGEYLDKAAGYIARYGEMLTPFPYRRFSVVENVLPTGYSMPTYTLLGRDVARLPFITDTSLGHEVLHQWLGGHVYCDCSQGNWVEGLVTYLSDHLYMEEAGEGPAYRKKLLADYQSYVSGAEGGPSLRDFTSPEAGDALRAVGYGKGAMVFHMLRGRLGDDDFVEALRSLVEDKGFHQASWADLEDAFEARGGEDLGWFFKQWLDRGDVPALSLESPAVFYADGRPSVDFRLRQSGEPYSLQVPIRIRTDDAEMVSEVALEDEAEEFSLGADGTPLEMVADPDYDLMRALSEDEYGPALSRLLGDEGRFAVVSEGDREVYGGLMEALEKRGFQMRDEAAVKDSDLTGSSFIVFGTGGAAVSRFFAGPGGHLLYEEGRCPDTGFLLAVRENPVNPRKVIAVACAASREEADAVSEKIFHYGGYALLRFEGGRNVHKAAAETMDGLSASLRPPVRGVRPSSALDMEEIIDEISETPVIYVAESHTSFEDHRVQLDVIRGLHRRGKAVAIGMEMFQRPFQEALDDYVAGRTDEQTFLKKSEYFTRWQFDYALYREILQFARAEGIPVVALNLRAEITRKVSAGGLDALDEEERAEVPRDMNMADEEYREGLMGVFAEHRGRDSFEHFYQAQVLWDETMAHSIAEFMEKNPGYQMVVLAGAGHVLSGSGIPSRAFRLTGLPFVTLVPSSGAGMDREAGDYVIFTSDIPDPASPKLGVLLERAEAGLRIKDVSADGPAARAGMRKGDVILEAGGLKVEGIEDVRIALVGKKPGDTLRVKVLRKKLFGSEARELEVVL